MVERIDSKIRMESKIDQSHLNSRKETKIKGRKEESLVLCKPRCRFRDFVRASVRYIVRDEP